MLHRGEAEGMVIISQPAHAWVSGQLARHWGNPEFGEFAPSEEVCLAATLHDIGFLPWEQSPTFNPATGLPLSFLDLPADLHLDIWSAGIQQLLGYGRYPTLLVSRHFTWLCEQHTSTSPANRRLEKQFLEEQDMLQTTLITSLRNDFYYEPYVTDEIVLRNRQLVSLWDWLSLLLCMGFREEQLIKDVPCAEGLTSIAMKPLNLDATRVAVSPWPFRDETLRIVCEGRHLLKRSANETEMREAIRAASPITLKIDLVRD
ncbi:MAG: hypothetical protein JWR69_3057 [Pedosphaera sp.]|nr:hypothetical protein [Pedosphaera sp.]